MKVLIISRSFVPMACALLVACADDVFDYTPFTREACSEQEGVRHSGNEAAGTWRRRESPHVLVNAVQVDGTLIIEPGALICGMPGSTLFAQDLQAVGAEGAPILFTSVDDGGWGGIRGVGAIRHSRIENAFIGVEGNYDLEDVHLARMRAMAYSGRGVLRNVVADSACTEFPAPCSAVSASGMGGVELHDVTIRWSGGTGASVGFRYAGLKIDGGAIEGSAGPGIDMATSYIVRSSLEIERPVRITGGGSYPVRVHAEAAVGLMGRSDVLGAMTGNARDTLYVIGNPQFGYGEQLMNVHIRPELPVRYAIDCGMGFGSASIGLLTLDPGASLTLGGCKYHGHVMAEGTAEIPIEIIGVTNGGWLQITVPSTDTATFRNVVFRNNMRVSANPVAAIFEDVIADSSSLVLAAAGSRIDGLHARRSGGPIPWLDLADSIPAVTLRAGTSLRRVHIESALYDGVLVDGAGVSISECTIALSGRHGVRVASGAPSIHSCNFVTNGGAGVSNEGLATVDAIQNWWGDATGPNGGAGDGATGNVNFTPFLTTSVQFSCGTTCTSPGATGVRLWP